MQHLYKAFSGALLVLGLVGITPIPALAGGYHWDPACNCRRPNHQYTAKRYVRLPPRVVTHRRVVNKYRVVPGRTRLIQENRVIVHVRPVIKREVVVHRTHTIVKDVVLRRVNTINRYRNVYYHQVVNVDGGATVRHVTEYRNVRGCNCGYEHGGYYRSGYGRGYDAGGYYRSGYSRAYGRGLFSGPVLSYRY